MLTRRTALALLVLPALAVVAFAARSYRPFGEGGSGERVASTTFIDSSFTIVLVLGAAVLTVLIWLRVRAAAPRRDGPSVYSGIVVLALVAVIAVAARNILHYEPRPEQPQAAEPAFPGQVTPTQPTQPVAEQGRGARVIWPLAIGLGALLATAVAIAVVLERRRQRGGRPGHDDVEELARALDEAIEDLRREPDPRRAVVAAYARMEQALTVYGLPRRPAEAPYEYLRRVARELEADRPMESLTELFEVAKFSEHTVDESMRTRAIDALSAVRREVRAAV